MAIARSRQPRSAQCSDEGGSHEIDRADLLPYRPLKPVSFPQVKLAQPQDGFWVTLLESIREGVMLLSPTLEVLYCNPQAQAICQQIDASREMASDRMAFPTVLVQVCQRLLTETTATAGSGVERSIEPLVAEYQPYYGQFIRVQARWISMNSAAPASHILLLLEDCYASMREELVLEQKKYELTDREAEIWILLRQEYSYQAISELLQISLNTVKTHVKNVYAKQRSTFGQHETWYSR